MKKQIGKQRFSVIITVIFLITIPAINSSCKKGATAENKTIDTPPGSTIIYTDVNPDSAISGNSAYNLDLNNDGIYDFTINTVFDIAGCGTRCGTSTINVSNVTIANGSNNGIVYKLADYLVSPLDSQTVIDSSSQWSYITNRALTIYLLGTRNCGTCSTSGGLWYGNVDKYMGLKLIKGLNTYYGGVRLNENTILRTLTIKDYAYNSSPNQSILAGQTR